MPARPTAGAQERRRRAEDLAGARAEERSRQQRHREAKRASRSAEEGLSRAGLGAEAAQIKANSSNNWDKAEGLSRAGLVRNLPGVLDEIDEMLGQVRQKIELSRAGLGHVSAAPAE